MSSDATLIFIPERRLRVIGGLSGVLGVLLLAASFVFAQAPPQGASIAAMAEFARLHSTGILFGGWLQAVGPVLIVLFAFTLVHLAGATARLTGWMTFFGATVLMIVSLIEITFYFAALFPDPPLMGPVALHVIYAVQHLYFIVAAPALFLPLGLVLLDSRVLPRSFGYLAILLAILFFALGLVFLTRLMLPDPVTAVAGVQALWWLAASLTLVLRRIPA